MHYCVTTTLDYYLAIFKKVKCNIGSNYPVLDIYPREIKTYVHKKTCT